MLSPILASRKYFGKLIFPIGTSAKQFLYETDRINKTLKNNKVGEKKYPS